MVETPEQQKQIADVRRWAEKEKRKAALPGYGTGYKTQVERQAQTLVKDIESGEPPPVKLNTGEYVTSETFYKLKADDQERLRKLGIEKFEQHYQKLEQEYEAEKQKFEAENVKLSTDEWVNKAEFNKLTPDEQSKLRASGVEDFNKWQQQQVLEFKEKHVFIEPKIYQYGYTKARLEEAAAKGQKLPVKNILKVRPWLERLPEMEGEAYTTKGGWVTKEFYDSLAPDQQKLLKDRGIEGFQAWFKGDTRDPVTFEVTGDITAPKPGTLDIGVRGIPKGTPAPSITKADGITYVKHGGVYWKRDDWEALPQLGKLASRESLSAYNKWASEAGRNFEAQNIKLKSGEFMARKDWQSLTPAMQKDVEKGGIKALDISDKKDIWQFKQLQEWGLVDKKYDYVKDRVSKNESGEFVIEGQPIFEKYAEKLVGEIDNLIENPDKIPAYIDSNKAMFMPENVIEKMREVRKDPAKMEAIKGLLWGIVPIAGTMYHWKSMSPWGKGLSTVADVAMFIPFIGMVSAGVRATARAGTSMTKAITMSTGRAVLAEIKAPITAIRHPVKTAQTVVYPIETVVRPGKIPLTATEIRENTVKIMVKEIGDAKSAKEARRVITDRAIQGDGVVKFTKDGVEIDLAPVALQKVGGSAAVHATPDIRPFIEGAEIKYGKEGGLFVSPTLHSRFTETSAFGLITTGDVTGPAAFIKNTKPGALIIRDKRVLAQMVPSDKIYRGSVEIEKLLPSGIKLSPPSQILKTRDVSGRLLHLAVIGEKFTPLEIAKLKFMGSVDLVKDIFRPSVVVKGGKATYSDLLNQADEWGKRHRALEKEWRIVRDELLSPKKRAKMSKTEEIEKIARRDALKAKIDKSLEEFRPLLEEWEAEVAASSMLRPIRFSTNDYIDDITYRYYAQYRPDELARYTRGLSRSNQERVYRALTRRQADVVRAAAARIEVVPRRDTVRRDLTRAMPRRAIVEPPRRAVGVVRRGVPARPPVRPPSRRLPPRMPPRVPPPVLPPTKPPRVPPSPPDKDAPEEYRKLTLAQKLGAVAWKQGFMYKLWYPPYHQDDIINTKEPIPGVKYHSGPRSAYKSLVRLRGPLAKDVIMRDMGIVDIKITGGMAEDRSKTKIHYTGDPKQKTLAGAGRVKV